MCIRIAVIDSNVDLEHSLIRDANIVVHGEDQNRDKNYLHGTTICYEIYKQVRDIEIHLFPIINNSVSPEGVIDALNRIYLSDVFYDVINMSFGFSDPSYHEQIDSICRKLEEKGTILVSAFNNWGIMTYPACLDSVIGVDLYNGKDNIKNYVYLNDKCINIMANRKQSIMATEKGTSIATSTSQFTAHISGIIARYMYETGNRKKELILEYLKENADKVVETNTVELKHFNGDYGKCMVFPYNKEIQALINLEQYFSGSLKGIYDFKYSKYIGKEICIGEKTYRISNIEKADIEQYDTVIIGHLDKYDEHLVCKVLDLIIQKCIRLNKRIYTLDGFIRSKYGHMDNINLIEPCIQKENVSVGQGGKMWSVGVPVVAVVGTNPHQGKFTSQIFLKQNLEKKGYNTGFISTEPTGYLFGADYVFPYGYNADMNISYDDYPVVINEMIYRSYCKKRDIIITGLQSGLLPVNYNNIGQNTYIQHAVMFGVNPDVIILCVSMEDSISLVKRTVQSCSNIYQADVMGILLYPVRREISPSGNTKYSEETDSSILADRVREIKNHIDIPIYIMNVEGYESITNDLIELLSD